MVSKPQLAVDAISSSATPAPESWALGSGDMQFALKAATKEQGSLFGSSPQSDVLHCESRERKSLEAAPIHETHQKNEHETQNQNRLLAIQTMGSSGREMYRLLFGAKTSTFQSFVDSGPCEQFARRIGAGHVGLFIPMNHEDTELRALLDAANSLGEPKDARSIVEGQNSCVAASKFSSAPRVLTDLTPSFQRMWANIQSNRGDLTPAKPIATASDSDDRIAPLEPSFVVPTLEARKDDRTLTSSRVILEFHRNDGKIYDALMQMAKDRGSRNDDGTRTIGVGYKVLSDTSGCDKRALERAWPRLMKWGFLKSIAPHAERQPARYIIRSIASVDDILNEAGCTHIRVMRSGTIQPFRSVTGHGEETS